MLPCQKPDEIGLVSIEGTLAISEAGFKEWQTWEEFSRSGQVSPMGQIESCSRYREPMYLIKKTEGIT